MQDQANRHIVTNGPIRLLQPELLRLIFLENTTRSPDWPFHDPLLTARSSSQVCQQWREILLSSSVLWGRLVVVNQLHFTKVNDAWRNEVLARAGSALLWIQGHVSVADHKIFLYFLEQNWERVERVDIIADRDISHYPRSVIETWKGLESKAPNLKAFSLNHIGKAPPFSQSVTHITHFLFKEGAPKLREISVPDMKFDTRSPWLSNIRAITLSIFSVQDMFTILKATPLLTNLDITMRPVGRSSQPVEHYQQRITLPFLDTFSLNAYFGVALPFLESLDFPATCIPNIVLDAHGRGYPSLMDKEHSTISIERDLVIKHIKKHLPSRRMTYMMINIATRWGMEFFFSGHDGIHMSTSLHLKGEINSLPHIVEELSICDYLPHVKGLVLTVDVVPSPSSYHLAQLPSCSVSLTTLMTNETTLKFFLDLKSERQDCVPFPALKILELTRLEPPFVKDKYPSRILWDFFQWQGTGPSPISIFDLSNIRFDGLYDMQYLDKVPGLKIVRWIQFPSKGQVQYECGRGNPAALRFEHILISYLRRMAQSRSTLRFPI